jgi:purine nucleosidase
MPFPVVLDTDIGTDIDDAYALALAAVSPELDLRAVTTVNSGVALRARIAKKLLRLLGRDEVPVLAGRGESYTPGVSRGWGGHEGRGIDLSGVEPDILQETAFLSLLDSLLRDNHARGQPLTLITIGALTNAAWLLEALSPETAGKIGRIVTMASTFEGFGAENARGEHNVACDPVAAERVLNSGIPVTLIGLNVTMQTVMTRADVEDLAACGSPLAEALAGMHRVWFDVIGRDHSPMHDGLAVAAVFRPELFTFEPVVPRVRHDTPVSGAIVYNPPVPGEVTRCRIAKSVNAPAFHSLLRERIKQAVVK